MALPGAAGRDEATSVSAETLFALRHIVRHVPEHRLQPTGRHGGFIGKKRGNGLEIVDVRPFVDGDDARHIDAAATARTAKTHVRTFRDERERTALLIADFRSSMVWGTRRRLRSVAAAGALALAGWRVVEGGGRVALLAQGVDDQIYLPPRSRERAMAAVTATLEEVHRGSIGALETGRTGAASLEHLLEQAIARSSSGTTIVLASSLDDTGPGFDRLLVAARRRFEIVLLLIRDPFETHSPKGAYPFLVIGEDQTASMRWGFVASDRKDRMDRRIEALRSSGIDLRVVETNAEWAEIATALETVDGPGPRR
ncbi:DUF58 domain-containing protein [Fulvimarina endophytica]|uniref:DUF58 domain-containing protein n=1 Tax=Fulvimarina endophytica TaxID=2293836 RepID=A0A371X8C2_9HYPH|nr:DUF58 domain-containing protein [Fulvimarina endophytica]RFC65467.1 DUF58 domain-containing protein [Fulvimarina endophytica]